MQSLLLLQLKSLLFEPQQHLLLVLFSHLTRPFPDGLGFKVRTRQTQARKHKRTDTFGRGKPDTNNTTKKTKEESNPEKYS